MEGRTFDVNFGDHLRGDIQAVHRAEVPNRGTQEHARSASQVEDPGITGQTGGPDQPPVPARVVLGVRRSPEPQAVVLHEMAVQLGFIGVP